MKNRYVPILYWVTTILIYGVMLYFALSTVFRLQRSVYASFIVCIPLILNILICFGSGFYMGKYEIDKKFLLIPVLIAGVLFARNVIVLKDYTWNLSSINYLVSSIISWLEVVAFPIVNALLLLIGYIYRVKVHNLRLR